MLVTWCWDWMSVSSLYLISLFSAGCQYLCSRQRLRNFSQYITLLVDSCFDLCFKYLIRVLTNFSLLWLILLCFEYNQEIHISNNLFVFSIISYVMCFKYQLFICTLNCSYFNWLIYVLNYPCFDSLGGAIPPNSSKLPFHLFGRWVGVPLG